MKVSVHYHNKPHKVRIRDIHFVPVSEGVWVLRCHLMGWQGQEVNSWGSDGNGDESVYFGDDETHDPMPIRAQLMLTPESDLEREPHIVDRLNKGDYEAMVIADRTMYRAWDEYINNKG